MTLLRVTPRPTASPDAMLFDVTGELDIGSTSILRRRVEPGAGAGRRITLDVRRLGFCDPAGLHALMDLHARAMSAGGSLQLINPRANLDRMMQVCRVKDRLVGLVPVEAGAGRPA